MVDLEKFADEVGIARDYIDANNEFTVISTSARLATLGALGYPIDDEQALMAIAAREQMEPFKEILDPVTVLQDGDKPFLLIRTLDTLSESALVKWQITLESGEVFKGQVPLSELEIASWCELEGRGYDTHRFFLPYELPDFVDPKFYPLPHGYHTFSVTIVDGVKSYKSIDMSLIIAPNSCYIPDSILAGRKVWGASVQLYTLRSKSNWGVGDFADLKQVLQIVHERGGHFVGLNPMHAGFPTNPDPDVVSPYSPSSRLWLNVLYISVPDVPEYANCAEAKAIVSSAEFQARLKRLRDLEYLDYKSVLETKLEVLSLVFKNAKMDDHRSRRGKKFADFIKANGANLINMATYDALAQWMFKQGKNGGTWRNFPKEYHDCNSGFVEQWRKQHQKEVDFFCYLQFIAAEQLAEAYKEAKDNGMIIGTYRDLAVGVSDYSCDVWSDSERIYCSYASVGAPPDTLGPLGQSWGLAPMSPRALRRTGYKALINLYRANMQSCGALRIDHAAGLYRFWWVPPHHHAVDGAYVYNNMHDWLGILALESQRHKCLVIAEDLGTIPMELRVALKEVGAFSYKLFFGERAFDGGYIAPQDYEPQALSAITTHDMPTLKGWWDNYDLTLGQSCGIYSAEDVERLSSERNDAKQRILDSIHGLGSVGDEVPRRAAELPHMTDDLAVGLERHMCRGSCALFSSQIEDWTGVLKPVNVPGTLREYPNWRRKLTMNLEDIAKDKFVHKITDAMTQARAEASAPRKFG